MTSEPPQSRREEVNRALVNLLHVARHQAMLPKNVEKGGWYGMSVSELTLKATEELGEVCGTINKGESLERMAEEIGDLAWVLGMLLDRVNTIRDSIPQFKKETDDPRE